MRRVVLLLLGSCSHAVTVATPRPEPPEAAAHTECPPVQPRPVSEALPMPVFLARLAERLDAHAESRNADFDEFVARHALERTDALRRDHARLRLLFEAARDGGFWRLRWDITNRDATSSLIWSNWRAHPPALVSSSASATAECDELSALLAALARGVGVRNVGLFWPTWNHTIAAWNPTPATRVLVPTSQIFLGCDDTFDATSFSPTHQKTVWEFPATDLGKEAVSAELATFLLDRIDAYGDASSDVLSAIRLDRAIRLGSSVPSRCGANANRILRARDGLSCADRRAIDAYAADTRAGPPDPSSQSSRDLRR
jgi:hypothetical protein